MAASFDDAGNTDQPRSVCKRCGRELHPGRGDFYIVSIVSIAEPSPVVITEEELGADAGREIQYLIARTRGLTAQAAEDQVHRRLVFHLCGPCHHCWIEDPTAS